MHEEIQKKMTRYSEPQSLAILRQAEGGVPVAEICREHGISMASFYKWRAKYGGMDGSMIAQTKALEDENRRLKKMFAKLIPSALDIDCCPISGRDRGYGCRVVREEVPGCAALVEDFVVGVEDGDGELVGAQVLPDVLPGLSSGPLASELIKVLDFCSVH